MAEELKRLGSELKSLEQAIQQIESQAHNAEPMELSRVTEALGRIDPIWEVLHPEEQRRVLELLIETITVSKESVEIRSVSAAMASNRSSRNSNRSEQRPMTDTAKVENDQRETYPGLTVRRDGDAIVVRIPVRFYRRNGRQMVLTQAGPADNGRENGQRNDALVTAIAKAYRWQEQLESGEYAGLEDLAAANGVDRTYVGRILRLIACSGYRRGDS